MMWWAHEMTHAVTDHESHLFYYMQSGAINESFSDIWGEFVDLTNGKGNDSPAVRWLMGEDIAGWRDPKHEQSAGRTMTPTGSAAQTTGAISKDNGGVHINSGVSNKAAYLMTDGGTFNGKTVAGLGITKAAKIYYEVADPPVHLGQRLPGSAQRAAAGLHQPGRDQRHHGQRLPAGEERGGRCGDESAAQQAARPTKRPSAPPGKCRTNLFFDDLETPTSGRWTKNALSGANVWYYPQNPNPLPGLGSDLRDQRRHQHVG